MCNRRTSAGSLAMTALVFTKPNIDHLKHALWHKFPEVGSAHLTEAVAAALGFNCNAGLRAKLESLADFPYFVLLSTDDLNRRLLELGYKFPKARSVTSFRCLGIPEDGSI